MQINEAINDREIRVIGTDGSQLGLMTSAAALSLAYEQNLDLVKISPTANPPVCKIMDYGKHRFEQNKKEKEIKKKQKIIEVKGMSLSLKIDIHDFDTKARQVNKFLENGDRVKVSIRFRGRELAHTDIGVTVMERFAQACAEFGVIDKPPKMEGRFMFMFMSPKAK